MQFYCKLYYKPPYLSTIFYLFHRQVNIFNIIILYKSDESSYYNHGIDIKADSQSVKAITDGKVVSLGSNEKLSGYIVVQNDDMTLIYGKIHEAFVSEGDSVSKGDLIGALDEENMILHIEVWEDGASINPTSLFDLTK
jgi:murein DD-endopeptidase MepM/ murein hydrolase activator NlpD